MDRGMEGEWMGRAAWAGRLVSHVVLPTAGSGRLQIWLRSGAAFSDMALLELQSVLCTNLRKIKRSGLFCTVREDEISFPQLARMHRF